MEAEHREGRHRVPPIRRITPHQSLTTFEQLVREMPDELTRYLGMAHDTPFIRAAPGHSSQYAAIFLCYWESGWVSISRWCSRRCCAV